MDSEQFARDALGQTFSEDEVPATECFAYPDGYGVPADNAGEIDELRDKAPAYPTSSALKVVLDQLSDGTYEIVRAKVHDTTTPQDNTRWIGKENLNDD